MKHYNNFISMLAEQEDIKKTNWSHAQVKYVITIDEQNGDIRVRISSEDLIFVFNKDGNFVGICNYKE